MSYTATALAQAKVEFAVEVVLREYIDDNSLSISKKALIIPHHNYPET
jgi:hypothetical protein